MRAGTKTFFGNADRAKFAGFFFVAGKEIAFGSYGNDLFAVLQINLEPLFNFRDLRRCIRQRRIFDF